MGQDLSKMMRLQLAGHGIPLAEPRDVVVIPTQTPSQPEVDRDVIRELLRPKVPPGSLEWLTRSCPSVQDARAFVYPRGH